MAVTVDDFENSGVNGATGKTRTVEINPDAMAANLQSYPLIVGNSVVFYNITDENNIVPYATFDLTANTGIDATAVNQVNPRLYLKTGGGGSYLGVVNYNTSGNCYVETYILTIIDGLITQFTPLGATGIGGFYYYLLGSNSPNGLINQIAAITNTRSNANNVLAGYIFADDIKIIEIDAVGGAALIQTINASSNLWGICGVRRDSDNKDVIFATESNNLNAWTIGTDGIGGFPVASLFSVVVDGDEARNVYHAFNELAVDITEITCVAVIVIKAGVSHVQFFDPTDGTLLGDYQCQTADTITDLVFVGTCMYVVTDGTAENVQSVDVADPTAPIFGSSSTVPSGTGYPLYSAFNADSYIASLTTVLGGLNGTEGALLSVELGDCASVTPPSTTGKLCVFALGSRLYVGDDDPKLEVFDISNPAAPSSLGTLALSDNPMDIWVNESNCYIAFHGGFYKINIDDPALMTLTSTVTTGDDFDYLSAPGGTVYLSGEAARLAAYNPGSAPPAAMDEIPIVSGGISAIALEGTRIFFADVAPGGTSKLYSYGIGGFSCHAIAAGVIGTDYLTTEEIYARHGKFKGDLVARSLLLTEMLATTGIVLVDTDDGSLQLLTIASGVVVVTPL